MTTATILLVEDNPITRKVVRSALERDGHVVVEAADGATAVRSMATHTPDIVLQSLLLPDADGFDLVMLLRAQPGGSGIPILALSGLLSKEDEARVASVGFDEFIAKPVEPTRLLETVRGHLLTSEPQSERYGAGRRVLIADDDPLQLKMLRFRLTQQGFEVMLATDGAEALEQARRAPPDAIITDALMPRLDGFGLCLAVRSDPTLSHLPLVLTTSSYVEDTDRQLAREAGASAFVIRTPDLREVLQALRLTLDATERPSRRDSPRHLEKQLAERALRQLERQVALNTGLTQRCSLLSAELSVLTAIAGSLARTGGRDDSLRTILVNCLDAAGASKGAIYLADRDGGFSVACDHGFARELSPEIATLFGHADLLARAVTTDALLEIPSSSVSPDVALRIIAGVGSPAVLLVPLTFAGEALGVLLLTTPPRRVRSDDWVAFGRAIGTQISVALAVARSFSRLRASEQRQRALMEHAEDAIFVADRAGIVLEANDAAERLLGRTREEILGRHVLDFTPASERSAGARYLAQARDTGVVRAEDTHVSRPDGRCVPVEFTVSRVEVGDEQLYLRIVRDVTERHALANELRQAQKMEAIGRLAGGIAHDFNNLLAVITSYTDLLIDDFPPSDPRREDLDEIRRAAVSATDLTRQLLAFGRRQILQPTTLDLNTVVAELQRMFRRVLGSHIAVAIQLDPMVGKVRADKGQMEQVLMNLVVNARDAMPEGGTVTITTTPIEIDASSATDHPLVPPGDYVLLCVADTGVGMDAETQSHIFEPFYTTKNVGEGTGLGLATVHGIVQQSGGRIAVRSEPGRGTAFRVYLPQERHENLRGES